MQTLYFSLYFAPTLVYVVCDQPVCRAHFETVIWVS